MQWIIQPALPKEEVDYHSSGIIKIFSIIILYKKKKGFDFSAGNARWLLSVLHSKFDVWIRKYQGPVIHCHTKNSAGTEGQCYNWLNYVSDSHWLEEGTVKMLQL